MKACVRTKNSQCEQVVISRLHECARAYQVLVDALASFPLGLPGMVEAELVEETEDEGYVEVVQVGRVGTVLGDLLNVGPHLVESSAVPLVAARVDLVDVLRQPERRAALSVVPQHDRAVHLDRRPCGRLHEAGHLLGIGDVRALALAVKLPAVEGARDFVADNATGDAQIGAHVRAIGVENPHLAILLHTHSQALA
jgi:hypothetical protein